MSAFGSAPVERGYWSGDRRAALDNLKELGLEGHPALIVAHTGGHPHVHVIANRVNPENGNATVLSQSKLKLSRWAEAYERTQGQIWCKERVVNNERLKRGEPVKDRVSQPSARFRREVTSPQDRRHTIAAQGAVEMVCGGLVAGAGMPALGQYQQRRRKALGDVQRRNKREWSAARAQALESDLTAVHCALYCVSHESASSGGARNRRDAEPPQGDCREF